MALQTANQFQLTPNIGGAIASGLQVGQGIKQAQQRTQLANQQQTQFEQGQKDRVSGIEAQKQTAMLQGAANAAVKARNLPDDASRINFLRNRVQEVTSRGGNPEDTIEVLSLFESGQGEQANALLDSFVKTSIDTGLIKAPKDSSFTLSSGQKRFDQQGNVVAEVGPSEEQKQATIIRKQEADLRAAELEDKKLERQIKIETNQLKKDELKTKLADNKIKAAQNKRDIKFNAQSSVDAVSNTVNTIDALLKGTGLESAAGFEANFPTIAGTEASDFEATLDTLQSQAFLSQVEKMKGLGALSENEGKKLAAGIGTLSINQSDKALRKELGRIKSVLTEAKKRMQSKFGIVKTKTGALDADEQAELQQLRAELGQ